SPSTVRPSYSATRAAFSRNSSDAQALIIGATCRTFKFPREIRSTASPGSGATRRGTAARVGLDFAVRLIYTLSLDFDCVANPAEERTLRRDLEGDEEYGARTMTALTPQRRDEVTLETAPVS
nr:hypothetical protein [Actinomycetota bacterium]